MDSRASPGERKVAGAMSSEVVHLPFSFEVRTGDVVRGDIWRPDAAVPGAAMVVCHGFKGFKDWGFFPYVAEELARRTSCLTASFNFTGCGVGADLETFTDLEGFSRNTISRELEDLEAVLDRLAAGRCGDVEVPGAARFGLLGHSRGGATCILEAATRSQVRGLVTWSAIAGLERYEEMYGERWDAGEVVEIPNARTGQMMPLRRNVLDDLRANRARLDVVAAARTLRIPWLIVHGLEDESVPFSDATRLAEAGGSRAAVMTVEGAGHTFGSGHPFPGTNDALEKVVERSSDLLRRCLTGVAA